MNTTAMILSFLAGSPGADLGQNPPSAADVSQARELVKQLADEKFKVRDAAEKQLVKLGVASLAALVDGEKNADIHVQERCRQLQPMIRSLTMQKRIDAFIANRDGPLPKDLPLVKEFIKIVGDTKGSRELYAEIVQPYSHLLDAAETDQNKAADQFAHFCQEVNQRMMYRPGVDYAALQKSITKADVAVYFLMTSELKKNTARFNNGYTFLNSPNLLEGLNKDSPTTEAFRKLFLHWLEKEPQPHIVQRGLQIAVDGKMKEATPLVLKFVKDKNAAPYIRAQSMLLLTRVGGKEHVKEIEPILEDKTIIGTFGINNKQAQVQVRDVALAASIKLSGQKMSEYDFDVMKANDEVVFTSYIYCAFSGDGKRDAAIKKYKESKEKKDKDSKDKKDKNPKDKDSKDKKDKNPKDKDPKDK